MKTRMSNGGYEARFNIERTDGKPIPADRRYMVLSFDGSDPEAVAALLHDADLVEPVNRQLAQDIRANIATPAQAPAQHKYA